jgi:hypothetical protein
VTWTFCSSLKCRSIRTKTAGRAFGNSIRIIGTDYLSLSLSLNSCQFTLPKIPFDRWTGTVLYDSWQSLFEKVWPILPSLSSDRWLTCAAAFSQAFRPKRTTGRIESSSRLSTTLFRNEKRCSSFITQKSLQPGRDRAAKVPLREMRRMDYLG